ncbi:MAG: ArsA family ATPase [Bacillati bacterium ANGP1]|uniref:ArsA family ATPase n=1 Tax=Candidatus Segetimicrobium genomatis TaxID=2569760 RepID=A0A537LJ68_9BACT|nr:MAG: ArsA family ATPase [Terrabacteria group bacterium ANGP1]
MIVETDPRAAVATSEQAFRQFLDGHPALKYVFFGGKGGVGKTVLAGAAAMGMAGRGKRTLLASTNPVHSLSGMLGQDVSGAATPVQGVGGLVAYEIDTRDTIEKSKQDIREKIDYFLKYAEIRTKADAFVESATMNPAFEESAMFENMIDLMFKDEYDAYVFDTAPTANARRLLGMSSVYSLWVNKMVQSRQEAASLRKALSYSKREEEQDPLMEYLLNLRVRMAQAKRLLTDAQKTAFFFVTLPEALPIAVIRRFIAWFKDFGIPIGGVIVNGIIAREQVGADAPAFVRNRVAMQAGYLREIDESFPGMVRARLPLLETEVRGLETVGRPRGRSRPCSPPACGQQHRRGPHGFPLPAAAAPVAHHPRRRDARGPNHAQGGGAHVGRLGGDPACGLRPGTEPRTGTGRADRHRISAPPPAGAGGAR